MSCYNLAMQVKLDPASIPENVSSMASAIMEASGRAFLVGGPVRDLLLGKSPQDWDIATDLSPDQVLRVFPGATEVGIRFGRVAVSGVDVVSLREESGYLDGRHPSSVTFGVSIEGDLKRRDFTVNAMAAEFDDLAIIDPYGGRDDLERRVLRAVGDPLTRLSEDPLRILRAIRLKTVLGFSLDPQVSSLLPDLAGTLATVSGERVVAEISRIFLAGAVCQGVHDLCAWGIGEAVLPEVFAQAPGIHPHGPDHLARALSLSSPDLSTRFAIAFLAADEASALARARSALARLGVALGVRQAIFWLIRNAAPDGFVHRSLEAGEGNLAYLARRLTDEADQEQVLRLIDVMQALWRGSGKAGIPNAASSLAAGLRAAREDSGNGLAAEPLAVSGEDAMEILGLTAGPIVGEALTYAKDTVLRDPRLNRRDLLADVLRQWWRRR